jgi:hypothetical protein
MSYQPHHKLPTPAPTAKMTRSQADSGTKKPETGSLKKPETGSRRREHSLSGSKTQSSQPSKADVSTKPPANPYARQIWIVLQHIEFATTPPPLKGEGYNTARTGRSSPQLSFLTNTPFTIHYSHLLYFVKALISHPRSCSLTCSSCSLYNRGRCDEPFGCSGIGA